MATEKMEFASADWLALLGKMLLAREVVTPDDAHRSVCEVYRNVPAHLCADPSRTIAWTLRKRNGETVMEFSENGINDVDRKIVGDYQVLATLSRYLVTAGNEVEFAALVESAVRQGQMLVIDVRGTPNPRRDYTVHNFIAALTR